MPSQRREGPASQERHVLAALAEIGRIATEDLELRPMLQRVADAMVSHFDWELVVLVRVDREANRFVCEAVSATVPVTVHTGDELDLGRGLVSRAAASGESVFVTDVTGDPDYIEALPDCRQAVCVPVRHRGEVVCLLAVESTRTDAFDGRLPLIETIGEQVAGAIASARLFESTRQRAVDFEILSEVSRTALEAEDLWSLLDRVVSFLHERFDVTVAVVLLDDGGQTMRLAARVSDWPIEDPVGTRWRVEEGVIGRACRTGEIQYVADVTQDPDYVQLVQEAASELAIPIRFRDRTLGVINFEAADPTAFSPERREVLRLVTEQIAGAIHLASVAGELSLATRELNAINRQLKLLAEQDGLTGVANRRRFDHALDEEWRRAIRRRRPVALALVDLDLFKPLNDEAGHLYGDECLKAVAGVLQRNARRAEDLVARYGGEEFAVLLPGLDAEQAGSFVDRLRGAVEELGLEHTASTVGPVVTVSAGVAAHIPDGDRSESELIAAADAALYEAKRKGRNRVVVAGAGNPA